MNQTQIMDPTPSADTTEVVTVGATPVVITMFAQDGVISHDVSCHLQRMVGEVAQNVPEEIPGTEHSPPKYVPVTLNYKRTEVVLRAPGDYIIDKPETTESIGFMKDEV